MVKPVPNLASGLDLFSAPSPTNATNEVSESSAAPAPMLSVSALNRSARDLIEHRFPLLWVSGEISNWTAARSGHCYFSLKDEAAQVRCVMFRHRAQHLDWQVQEGARVEVRALVTLYEARGDFQLNVEFMRRAGQGALYEAFLRLRDRLAAEGLFDAAHKRALPAYPRAIGVVTSLHAAALRDVLTTLARRNPSIPVVIYPTAVQGEAAARETVAALAAANRRAEVDVLILCRGGGSIEDLQSFNDEALARALRASAIPVVSGVGHETDFTIADFAADCRAPTPTAAAELVSPPRAQLLTHLANLVATATRVMTHRLESHMQQVDHLSRRLVHPAERLHAQQQLLSQLHGRLVQAAARALEQRHAQWRQLYERSLRALPDLAARHAAVDALRRRLDATAQLRLATLQGRLDGLGTALTHLDPQAVLMRGYSIVRDAHGNIVRAANRLTRAERLRIDFAQGSAHVHVEDTSADDT